MITKEQPPPPPPKLVKLDKAFKLAEQWVNNMTGDVDEETGELEMEGRPSRLGLGAKVPRNSQVGTLNDPVAKKLHKKLEMAKRKAACDERSKNELEDGSDSSEDMESRTKAFAKKRAAVLSTPPPVGKKKKPK